MSKKLIAVVGPTGSGKTALAVKLAKKFNGVLISADSRQVYRGLGVGTNKEGVAGEWNNLPARMVDGVAQLLVDVAEPGERFTLNDWLVTTRYALERIWQNGQLPIIVGGTGLYVTALLEGYEPGQGRGAKTKKPVDFESLVLQTNVEREVLYENSDERFVRVFDAVVAETKHLLVSGVSADWVDAIGLDYRYALKSIAGELSREAAISQFQAASRAYIRRQLTWWRHHNSPFLIKSSTEAEQKVQEFLGK
ncbi:MAG TPA: isopentenyl transferase family protein [Candidatus Saccharimonadales bacterium]|nr:isopentenyl transferase family protein [Candidatus Saccharimonadales bacterium]